MIPTDTPTDQDDAFVQSLLALVKSRPDLEMDGLCDMLVQYNYPRPYVNSHLQAIYAAMLRGRGEI